MFTFDLTNDSGATHTVTSDSRDIVTWEMSGKNNSLANLANLKMTDLYGIAYAAARRQGVFAGDISQFVATHTLALVNEDDSASDPTQTAA